MSEEYKKVKKVIEFEMIGDAVIEEVELNIPKYNEEDYESPEQYWEEMTDLDYDFSIEGKVNVKLLKNGEEIYGFDNNDKFDFVIEGSWSWSRGYSAYLKIYDYVESLYTDTFDEDEIHDFVKDCIYKKSNDVAKLAIEYIGSPGKSTNFSEVTDEWIWHA